jgi:hypothetical protein
MAPAPPPIKIKDPFLFLRDLSTPRPFNWYKFVEGRRRMYGWGSLALLLGCVVLPLLIGLSEIRNEYNFDKLRPNQIALYFGALVVVAFVRYSYVLHKLWDDSKWLARYGQIEEANLLWVIHSKDRLIVTYRFWTFQGKEVMKETVIDADGPNHLADLSAGDVVPVLFDPRSPRTRSMLWAEIERYVTIGETARRPGLFGTKPVQQTKASS